jgi:hypothetical protein
MLIDMAADHHEQELADKYAMSECRIRQMRCDAAAEWQSFHGEVI